MGVKKIAKQVVGAQGIQDRKEALALRQNVENKYENAKANYECAEKRAKDIICELGKVRLNSLKNTVGRFLVYLKDLEQRNKEKSYEILDDIQIPQDAVNELENLEISASTALAGAAAAGAMGTVAAFAAASGASSAVTSVVVSFASASTGTAIASLHGAAATNATLAVLGGGTLANGGGGVAGGAALLGTIGTTAGVIVGGAAALAVAGLIVSHHYSKKLTEAKEYEKDVEIAIEKMKSAEVVLEGIRSRAEELKNVTESLERRASIELDYLEPLVPDFDFKNEFYTKIFQKCGLLVKALGEIAKTPLLEDNGEVSSASEKIILKTHTLLNSEI